MKQWIIFVMMILVFSACKGAVDESPVKTAPEGVAPLAPSEDPTDLFKGFTSRKASLAFEVEYQLTANGVASKMTQFVKKSLLRTDISAQGVESRVYVTADGMFTCMNQGDWSCFTLNKGQESYDSAVKDVEANPENYKIEKLPNREVAGTSASCFRITTEGTVEYCLSGEGVPLYMKSTGDGYTSEMVAQRYSLSVPDSVFKLPAEPQDLSALANFNY